MPPAVTAHRSGTPSSLMSLACRVRVAPWFQCEDRPSAMTYWVKVSASVAELYCSPAHRYSAPVDGSHRYMPVPEASWAVVMRQLFQSVPPAGVGVVSGTLFW